MGKGFRSFGDDGFFLTRSAEGFKSFGSSYSIIFIFSKELVKF
jgi:hypothetical protein